MHVCRWHDAHIDDVRPVDSFRPLATFKVWGDGSSSAWYYYWLIQAARRFAGVLPSVYVPLRSDTLRSSVKVF